MPAGTVVGQGTIDIDATPVSSPAAMTHLGPISVVVREFDSADNAGAAFEQIGAGVEASMPGVYTGGTLDITSETLPDIGSQATRIRTEHTDVGVAVWMENVIVQRDRYVFFVTAEATQFATMGESEPVETSLPTVEIAAAIAANGEPSPQESAFMEDGTSTGGLWGFMPPADDPLLMGLVPVQDFIVYPAPGE